MWVSLTQSVEDFKNKTQASLRTKTFSWGLEAMAAAGESPAYCLSLQISDSASQAHSCVSQFPEEKSS